MLRMQNLSYHFFIPRCNVKVEQTVLLSVKEKEQRIRYLEWTTHFPMFTIQVLITLLLAKNFVESCKSSSPCDLGRFYPPAPPKEGQNWMSRIDGKNLISDLSIPGTHDSSASPCAEIDKLICPWTQTQYWTLSGQLEAGIRYFDLRCRHYHNGCPLHHGPVYLHANLRSAVQDVVRYVIVVMYICT